MRVDGDAAGVRGGNTTGVGHGAFVDFGRVIREGGLCGMFWKTMQNGASGNLATGPPFDRLTAVGIVRGRARGSSSWFCG